MKILPRSLSVRVWKSVSSSFDRFSKLGRGGSGFRKFRDSRRNSVSRKSRDSRKFREPDYRFSNYYKRICKFTVQSLLSAKLLETRILRIVWRDVYKRVYCVLSTWTLCTPLSSIAEKFGRFRRMFQNLREYNKD